MSSSFSTDLTENTLNPIEEQPKPRNMGGAVTIGLIVMNCVVFIVMVASGVPFLSPSAKDVLPWGANFGPLTLTGQWWRLLTACFLHFGIIHIAFNMYAFLRVGVITEALFGKGRYLFFT